MNKSIIFLAFLTCFTGLMAMEENQKSNVELSAKAYVVKTSDGKEYAFDACMISFSPTLQHFIHDEAYQEAPGPIPLPSTIASEDFDTVYAWFKRLALYANFNIYCGFQAIERELLETDLKQSQLQALLDIVHYLEIRSLVEIVEGRKLCLKFILKDEAILWVHPDDLKNCSTLVSIQEMGTNDEAIEFRDISRDTFWAIITSDSTQRAYFDQKKFIIPSQLIQELIYADRLGNETLLKKIIDQLVSSLIKNLNVTSFNGILNVLHEAFMHIPETVHYDIFKELLQTYESIDERMIAKSYHDTSVLQKTDELSLQEQIDFMLFYILSFNESPKNSKSLKKLVLSSPTFFAFSKPWQDKLLEPMQWRTRKGIKFEFNIRKNAVDVDNERGLVKIAAKKIVDGYFSTVQKEKLLENIDSWYADFNKKIASMPEELKVDVANALIEKTMKRMEISEGMPKGEKRGFLALISHIPKPPCNKQPEKKLNFAFIYHCLSYTKTGNQHQLMPFYNSKLYQKGLSEEAKTYLNTLIEEGYGYPATYHRIEYERIKKTAFRDKWLDFGIGYAASIGFQAFEQTILNSFYSDDASSLKKCALGLTSLGLKTAYYYGLAKMPCFAQVPNERILGSALGSYVTSHCHGNPVLNGIEAIKIFYGHAYAWGAAQFGPQEVKNFFRLK